MTDRVVAVLRHGLVDPQSPLLRADDLGVLRGEGIFETVLVIAGVPVEFEAHLTRMTRSAAMLEMGTPDLAEWRICVRDVIDAWDGGPEMVLRLVLTRGVEGSRDAGRAATGFAIGSPVPRTVPAQRRHGVAAVTLTRGTVTDLVTQAPWLLPGAKTLSYATNMAALRYAERLGFDEVVFTAADGSVLEGPTSTVVIARGDTLITPPAEAMGILPGITQAVLFRAARAAGWHTRTDFLRVPDLLDADGVWLCSSVRLLTRVHTLGDRSLPDTGLTSRLFDLLPLPTDSSAPTRR